MPDTATETPVGPHSEAPPSFSQMAEAVAPELESRRKSFEAAGEDVQAALKKRGEFYGRAAEQFAQRAPMPEPPPVITLPKPPSRQLSDFLAPVENEPPERSVMKFISALSVLGAGIG